MKELLFTLSLFFTFNIVNAQFQDNFDDGSFPNDPDWFGNVAIYSVNTENELQLMDIDEGQSFIYTPISTADSTTWEFYFRLEFDPSGTNRLKVFLSSDSPNFDGDLNGYFLQIGQSGSDDAIELWRQDGSNKTLILSGTAGNVATEPSVRARITRDNNGIWQLFTDYSGGSDFQLDGSVLDDTFSMSSYFGFHCSYSVTRKDKFYFDDIIIGPLVLDESPPSMVEVSPINANSVLVSFNETLDQTSAETVSNYDINNGVTVNAAVLENDPSQVLLSTSDLISGQFYELTSMNIADQSGNFSSSESIGFTFYEFQNPDPFDILINEIFPDPDPNISSLPDAEFFELYNASDKAFNLEGFKIADASSEKTLPFIVFPPNAYLIICDDEALSSFSTFGTTVGIPSLFKLNDIGDDLSIADTSSNIIHSISFTTDWYKDEAKKDGGWSIEMVNPNLYCQGEDNWRASENPQGGSPGIANSVFDNTPDSNPPSLLNAIPISQNEVRLYFNEIMDSNASNPQNYSIQGVGNISEAVLEMPSLKTVLLTIQSPFFSDQENYTVQVDNSVADCSGNNIGASSTTDFIFYASQPADRYDILINEFFPDPSPAIGLPEQEFIELFNRSEKVINLEDFIISNGSSEVVLPFHLLLPESYVIIYGSGGESYAEYGDTIVLNDQVGLTNTSGDIELLNPNGNTIHAISYNQDWYHDNSKNEGGWSLELINPDAPCAFSSNWRASVNANGGTPGKINSVFEIETDNEGPDLVKVFPLSQNLLGLSFTEALDETAASTLNNYEIEGIVIVDAYVLPPLFNQVLLTLSSDLQENQLYEIIVKSSFTDCLGNSIGLKNSLQFALPQTIEPNDIIINEFLFNPETGGQRFIELYNRSNKTFDLSELIIATRNPDSGDIEKAEPVEISCLLLPKEYAVLTASPGDISDRYFVENPYALLPNKLPTFDDKQGTVLIYTPQVLGEKIIDEFEYTEDFHNQLLSNPNGVSLERIDPDGETNDRNNWHSAATSVGFATPTYQNSQFFGATSEKEEIFSIPNKTLSPDGDGFEDFLLINYKTGEPGFLTNIRIFDSKGRAIKNLVSNELLGAEGNFKWDGDTDTGKKARLGIYIVWIEYFNPEGEVNRLKKTCVIAGRLN